MWLIDLSCFPHLVCCPIVIPSITHSFSAFLSFLCSPFFNPCSPSLLFLSGMLPLLCPLQACCCGDSSKGKEREKENYHFFNSLHLPSLHLSVHSMPCQLLLLSITFFFLPPESISHPVLNCFTCYSPYLCISRLSRYLLVPKSKFLWNSIKDLCVWGTSALNLQTDLCLLIISKLFFYMPSALCLCCACLSWIFNIQIRLARVVSDGDVLMCTLWLRRC